MNFNLPILLIFLASGTAIAGQKVVEIGLASNFSEISQSSSNPFGGYFKDGVLLAVKDARKKLEAKGIKIHFQEFDYGTDQLRALKAAKDAIASSAIAVLGYNWSSHALLAGPLHQKAGLPMLTPSATASRLSAMGAFVHLGAFDNAFMGETLARVARTRLKAKTAAIVVAEDCAYCHDLADGFEAEFKKNGGVITLRAGVTENQRDFSGVADQLKLNPPEVILVPNYELVSVRIVSALIERGIRAPFLGGDGWGDIGEEFYKILNGRELKAFTVSHWHPDLRTKESVSFKKNYERAYGKAANDTAVLAYDSMSLLIQAILVAKSYTRNEIETALNSIHNFQGATGRFRYGSSGAPAKSIVLLSANQSRFQVVGILEPPKSKGASL